MFLSQHEIFLTLGSFRDFDLNGLASEFKLKRAEGVRVAYCHNDEWLQFRVGSNISRLTPRKNFLRLESIETGIGFVVLHEFRSDGTSVTHTLHVTTLNIQLAVDADRDGVVEHDNPGRAFWNWGCANHGAILPVNTELIPRTSFTKGPDNYAFSEILVEPTGLQFLPQRTQLVISVDSEVAQRISVYVQTESGIEQIIGPQKNTKVKPIAVSRPLPASGCVCYAEAHYFPSEFFDGLVELELQLVRNDEVECSDRVVFRVASWVLPPATCRPRIVFICQIDNSVYGSNKNIIDALKIILKQTEISLFVIPEQVHSGDQWIRDSVAFGYFESPKDFLYVALKNARKRGLCDFPDRKAFDFEVIKQRVNSCSNNSLDLFGNIIVSPPVRNFPLGRMILGGNQGKLIGKRKRAMTLSIKAFLHAQKVQTPFEVFTGWLRLGHVDQIISFVEADNDIGFKVLIASPQRANEVLQSVLNSGQGDALLFEGRYRIGGSSRVPAQISVSELLDNSNFWLENERYQNYMDKNQFILQQELDLDANDIVPIPLLFYPDREQTDEYFPNMVNQLAIGSRSITSKPFGPMISGKCAFELAVEESLPDRNITFIDDWYIHHQHGGGVHCGTNTLRQPPRIKWWEHQPQGGFNV